MTWSLHLAQRLILLIAHCMLPVCPRLLLLLYLLCIQLTFCYMLLLLLYIACCLNIVDYDICCYLNFFLLFLWCMWLVPNRILLLLFLHYASFVSSKILLGCFCIACSWCLEQSFFPVFTLHVASILRNSFSALFWCMGLVPCRVLLLTFLHCIWLARC